MKKRLPKITEGEVRSEWARLELEMEALPPKRAGPRRYELTDEQRVELWFGRSKSWLSQEARWKQKYGWGSITTLQRLVERLKAAGDWPPKCLKGTT